mmetsp:Transcript_10462/g.29849  ORF Transcript_10462/g.29849 Transcript_10462/m.29849 type:complete len:244 (+) Transcript_10462:993-1724(+)
MRAARPTSRSLPQSALEVAVVLIARGAECLLHRGLRPALRLAVAAQFSAVQEPDVSRQLPRGVKRPRHGRQWSPSHAPVQQPLGLFDGASVLVQSRPCLVAARLRRRVSNFLRGALPHVFLARRRRRCHLGRQRLVLHSGGLRIRQGARLRLGPLALPLQRVAMPPARLGCYHARSRAPALPPHIEPAAPGGLPFRIGLALLVVGRLHAALVVPQRPALRLEPRPLRRRPRPRACRAIRGAAA